MSISGRGNAMFSCWTSLHNVHFEAIVSTVPVSDSPTNPHTTTTTLPPLPLPPGCNCYHHHYCYYCYYRYHHHAVPSLSKRYPWTLPPMPCFVLRRRQEFFENQRQSKLKVLHDEYHEVCGLIDFDQLVSFFRFETTFAHGCDIPLCPSTTDRRCFLCGCCMACDCVCVPACVPSVS